MLAGISVDYYLRLERGRDRSPSTQVLESLSRVLRLDDETKHYLLNLAAIKPRTRQRPRKEIVPSTTARLVATLPLPAFIEGRNLDVLAANPLATALSPRLSVGGNRLRDMFLDPGEQALWPDWEAAAAALVASFRGAVGTHTDDPRSIELVGELSLASPLFRRLWSRHDVRPRGRARVTFLHPLVGELHLDREKMHLSQTDGMMLVIFHPVADTADADKLALLSSAAMTPHNSAQIVASRFGIADTEARRVAIRPPKP